MTDSSDRYGVNTMTGTLARVAMRRPGAILGADHERWHYATPLNPSKLEAQYREFANLVGRSGAEIVWLPDGHDDLADSIFTYDPSFVIGDGAVVLRPGKELRIAESQMHAEFYSAENIPILGAIESPGTFEGGDCFWLDESHLAVGRGFRTNTSGIDQFAEIVRAHGVEVIVFDLPFHRGPQACLHLMSVVSPLDLDLALVFAPLMPTALWELMKEMGYQLLSAPEAEFNASLGLNLNVLATGPRQLIAIEGFGETLDLMRGADCEVVTFKADELCLPCEGGPTCLTRPLLRL